MWNWRAPREIAWHAACKSIGGEYSSNIRIGDLDDSMRVRGAVYIRFMRIGSTCKKGEIHTFFS